MTIRQKVKKFLSILGPGFITGSSDDDPSGIATYSQTGALFGLTQLWTALYTTPFMTSVQEACGRIGMVTGKGLAGIIRRHYSKPLLYTAIGLLLFANTINIGADLGAMASSAQLVFGLPFSLWLIIMVIITLLLEVFVSYRVYSRVLKYLAFSLFSYVIVALILKQDWSKILQATFTPHFILSRDYIINLAALLGTTISPYLFFWQADEEVEEEIEKHKLVMMGRGVPKIRKHDIREMKLDTTIGILFSQTTTFFIIIAAASTLGAARIINVQTANQAAEALRPLAGNFTFLLFALGIVGTGLLAVPVLAGSASYAIAEAFGWKEGLYRKFKQAHGFYGVITIATLLGLLINFSPLKPFQILYYTAVLNGIFAPPLLAMIIIIGNNKQIMGNYTNSWLSNLANILITVVMTLVAAVVILSFFYR